MKDSTSRQRKRIKGQTSQWVESQLKMQKGRVTRKKAMDFVDPISTRTRSQNTIPIEKGNFFSIGINMFAPVRKKRFKTDSTSSGEGMAKPLEEQDRLQQRTEDKVESDSDNDGVWFSNDKEPQRARTPQSSESDSDTSSDTETDNSGSSTSSSSSSSREGTPEPRELNEAIEGNRSASLTGSDTMTGNESGENVGQIPKLPDDYTSDVEEFDSGTESEEEKPVINPNEEDIDVDSEEMTSLSISIPRMEVATISHDSPIPTPIDPSKPLSSSSPPPPPPPPPPPSSKELPPPNTTSIIEPSSNIIDQTASIESAQPQLISSYSSPAVAMPTLNPLAQATLTHLSTSTSVATTTSPMGSSLVPPCLSPFLSHLYQVPQRRAVTPDPSLSVAQSLPPNQQTTPLPLTSSNSQPSLSSSQLLHYMQILQQQRQLASMPVTSSTTFPSSFQFPYLHPYHMAYRNPTLPQLTPLPSSLRSVGHPWSQGMVPPFTTGGVVMTSTQTPSTQPEFQSQPPTS